MKHLLALIIFALTLPVLLVTPAAAADPFTVAGISIDGRGGSAIEAQTNAIQQGYVEAAYILFDRGTLASERQANPLPDLTPTSVGPLIRGQTIDNERRSTTRYLGNVTIAFNPSAVQQFLRRANLTMVSSQARERVVVILDGAGSGDLRRDLTTGRYAHALVPLKAAADADIATYRMSPNETGLQNIARRNNVGTVVVVEPLAGSRLSVQTASFDGGNSSRFTVNGGLPQLVARLENDWKTAAAVPSSEAKTAQVSVLYTSLRDWQYLQQAINTAAQVRDARLDALSKDGALMTLTFGQLDRLQTEMGQKGVIVERDPQLGLIIRR